MFQTQHPSNNSAPMNPWLVMLITFVVIVAAVGGLTEAMIIVTSMKYGMILFIAFMFAMFVVAPLVYALWQHKRNQRQAPTAQTTGLAAHTD